MGGVILRTVDPGIREKMAERLGTTRRELEHTLFLSPSSLKSEIGEISDVDHWKIVLEKYHQPLENYQQMYREFFSGDEIDLELIAYMRKLKEKNLKVALLSNAWVNTRQNMIHLYDFLDLFDVSIFSAEVGLRKPDERIFKLVLERLQVSAPEAIFVDDYEPNIEGAAALGLNAILYQGRENAVREINNLLGI